MFASRLGLNHFATSSLFEELSQRGEEYIQLVPSELMIRELMRRNVGLNDIVAVGLDEAEAEQLPKRQVADGSEGEEGAEQAEGSEHELSFLEEKPANHVMSSNKLKMDIKQYSSSELVQIAFRLGVISKREYQELTNIENPISPSHLMLAERIVKRLPNLYYISSEDVPFSHYHETENRKLRVYHYLQKRALINNREYGDGASAADPEMAEAIRNSLIDIQRLEANNEEQSEDQDLNDFINNDDEEEEQPDQSLDREIKLIDERHRELRKRQREEPSEERKAPSKKKSKMLLHSDSEEDLYQLPKQPMKKLHRSEAPHNDD